MKALWSGLCVAFSMYSSIPMPQIKWANKTMRYALCFLPLVGIVIAIAEWLWFKFCTTYHAASLFYAVGAVVLSIWISGGIHLDGLADVSDAIGSHVEPEKRLQIMKDPHIGAFGVLGMAMFLLAECAVFAQLYQKPTYIMLGLFGFVLSRIGGGRAIVALPCAKNTGLAYLFAENSEKLQTQRILLLEMLISCMLLLMYFPHIWSGVAIAIGGVWLFFHKRLCCKQFGGITGDLSGFFISITELLFLIVGAIGGLCT